MAPHPWTIADMRSQEGRLAFVTGATSGLGFEVARALAGAGARVVLAARNADKADRAMEAIRSRHPVAHLEFRALDTASLSGVRAFAEGWSGQAQPIDMLVLNAGISSLPRREETEDGFERQLGANYLGHFALTGLLMPFVRQRPASRIVEVASLAHARTTLHLDDLQLKRSYGADVGYGQSKLAMLIFGLELDRRLKAAGSPVRSIPAHPGVAATDITRAGGQAGRLRHLLGRTLFRIIGQTPAQGALPLLFAATAPDAMGGVYYGPDGWLEARGHPAPAKVAAQAKDPSTAVRLWEISEALTGVSYDIRGASMGSRRVCRGA